MAKEKILIVEDDIGIKELMQLYLNNRDYHVMTASYGGEALQIIDSEVFDIVLLDIEMPGLDGFEVCRRIRKKLDLPIIFVSSRRDVMDKLRCFELGGDDYITKPFDFAELEARITANLRRYDQVRDHVSYNILVHGPLKVNLESFECYLHGEKITLSKKETQLLILLVKRPNQVFSSEQIYDQIWGLDSFGDVQTVKVHIRNLRRKLEKDPSKPNFIQTVRGFGYRFVI